MGHSPACWGSWYSVLIAGEESMGPWLIKIHPRFTRQTKRGREIGGGCFLFCSPSHRASWYGLHGLTSSSQDLSPYFRETSADRKRSSCFLRTLLHWGVPDAFSWTQIQQPHSFILSLSGPFHYLASWLTGVAFFSLPNRKWLWRMVLLTSRGQKEEQKALLWLLLPCTGIKRMALLAREQVTPSGLPLFHRSYHPWASGTMRRQQEAAADVYDF